MNGYIYFLLNPSMKGLLKIGFTESSVEKRIRELNTTGVPEPFVFGAAFYVSQPQKCESELHELFKKTRKKKNREFFEIPLAAAIQNAMPILTKYISSDAEKIEVELQTVKLEGIEMDLMWTLIHSKEEKFLTAFDYSKEYDHQVHEQDVLYACGNLKKLGFINERRLDGVRCFFLTDQGRAYCYENKIIEKEYFDG